MLSQSASWAKCREVGLQAIQKARGTKVVWTALTSIDGTNDVLTAAMIDICKRKATIPVNATAKIRPMMVKVGKNFEEWFVFVGHTYAIRALSNSDGGFRNAHCVF